MHQVATQLAQVAQRESADPPGGAVVRDAFRPAESWLPPPPQKTVNAGEDDPQARARAKAQAFARDHRLLALVAAADNANKLAIVNDRTLLPGQTIDGFTLVELGQNTAEFACGQTRVTLKLHADPTPAPR